MLLHILAILIYSPCPAYQSIALIGLHHLRTPGPLNAECGVLEELRDAPWRRSICSGMRTIFLRQTQNVG